MQEQEEDEELKQLLEEEQALKNKLSKAGGSEKGKRSSDVKWVIVQAVM